MADFRRMLAIPGPVDEVRGWLQDFEHAREWMPLVKDVTPLDPPPIAVGSRWQLEGSRNRHFGFAMALVPSNADVLKFQGNTLQYRVTIEFRLESFGERTIVVFSLVVRLRGPAGIFDSFGQQDVDALGSQCCERLAQVLQGELIG